jgi:hypothetical protein
MCAELDITSLMTKEMTFRELFWAHLTHRKNRWTASGVVLLLTMGLVAYQTGAILDMRFQFLVVPLYLVLLLVSNSTLFALAHVSPKAQDRAEEFYWTANWWQYSSMQLVPLTFFLVSLGLFLRSNLFLYFVSFAILFVLGDFCWRYWRVKHQSRPVPQSHFKGHEHHSSKTVG